MFEMAAGKIGALIVLTRKDPIGTLVSNGIRIDAEVSKGLIEAIFRKDSPIHDGAVLIEGERIAYAGLVLPLSGREDVPSTVRNSSSGGIGTGRGLGCLSIGGLGRARRGGGDRWTRDPCDGGCGRATASPLQAASGAARFDMEFSSQAVVRQYPIPAFSRRACESDLGRFVPGRRDDCQGRSSSRWNLQMCLRAYTSPTNP